MTTRNPIHPDKLLKSAVVHSVPDMSLLFEDKTCRR